MIDYKKLIEIGADEIHKTYLYTCDKLQWEVKEANKVPYDKLSEDSKELDRASFKSAINTLIYFGLIDKDKLKELNKSEPKYKVGQEVWLNDHDTTSCFFVQEIKNTRNSFKYKWGEAWYSENLLYPSRQALIDSQIKHWQDMQEEDCENDSVTDCTRLKCEHEWSPDEALNVPLHCMKCGENYRC